VEEKQQREPRKCRADVAGKEVSLCRLVQSVRLSFLGRVGTLAVGFDDPWSCAIYSSEKLHEGAFHKMAALENYCAR